MTRDGDQLLEIPDFRERNELQSLVFVTANHSKQQFLSRASCCQKPLYVKLIMVTSTGNYVRQTWLHVGLHYPQFADLQRSNKRHLESHAVLGKDCSDTNNLG